MFDLNFTKFRLKFCSFNNFTFLHPGSIKKLCEGTEYSTFTKSGKILLQTGSSAQKYLYFNEKEWSGDLIQREDCLEANTKQKEVKKYADNNSNVMGEKIMINIAPMIFRVWEDWIGCWFLTLQPIIVSHLFGRQRICYWDNVKFCEGIQEQNGIMFWNGWSWQKCIVQKRSKATRFQHGIWGDG